MRVVIYARVSTLHHEQKPEAQVAELCAYCAARAWTVTEQLTDHGYSGGTDQRPGLKRLMTLVRSRKVDVVAVTKMDRLFRSLRHLISVLDEFQSVGVQFVSVRDQIDLTTASGRLMVQILGAFSEFERALIRERTMAGLAHARNRGKRLGRPPIHDLDSIRALRALGLSYRRITSKLGVPMGTITKALRTAHKSPSLDHLKTLTKSGDGDA